MGTVSTPAGLKAAIAAGIRTIELAPIAWPDIAISDCGGATITAEGAKLSRLLLTRCHDLEFEGLSFARSALKTDGADIWLGTCQNVRLDALTMRGGASKRCVALGTQGQIAIEMGGCSGVTLSRCAISGYGQGIRGSGDRLTIKGCDLSAIQADGIQIANVRDLLIEGNVLHDFLGSADALNHDDMIQLFTTGATVRSERITIRRNRLIAGSGEATQAIFIGNEIVKADPKRTDMMYRDVLVEGNYVSTDNWHGITIYGAEQPAIRSNIVLRNRGAKNNESGNDGVYIQNPLCTGSVVDGNIADKLLLAPGTIGANVLAAKAMPDQWRAAMDRMNSPG